MIFLTLSSLLYFAPALLATSRRNPQATAIWLTNFFVGWTIIGWVIVLIWALNTPPLPYGTAAYAQAYPGPPTVMPATAGPGYTSADAGAGAVPGWSAVGGSATTTSAPGEETLRTCVACGHAVPADARFCPACGSVESRLG